MAHRRLYCLTIDLGSEVRAICSGLVEFLRPEDILSKKVVVLANLPKKTLRGEESNGMVLCVSNEDRTAVELLEPPAEARVRRAHAQVGERVFWEGLAGEPDETLSTKKGKETFAMVQKVRGAHAQDFVVRDGVGFFKVTRLTRRTPGS